MKVFSPASAPAELQINQTSKSSRIKPSLLFGVTIAIIIVFVICWLCFCLIRRRHQRQRAGKLDAKEMKLRKFEVEEIEKATNNFSEDCLIGCGAFGNVYRGTFVVEGTLAIKIPHSQSYTTTQDFRNEVRLLSKVKHHNLVGLVGFCEQSGRKAAKILVYEYVKNGSLLDYIIGRGEKSLTWRERVNIAIGAAKGIAHLHEGIQPSIIHRDLKPSNILIGEGFEAKVSDFGLVRSGPVGDESHVSSQVKGTPGYLDPAYCSSFHLTPFTDVYSFGVILLQLLTAGPALDSTRKNTSATSHIIDWTRPSIESGNIGVILDGDLLEQGCNMEMMLKMGQLALRCVEKVPKERPTMSRVWRELEDDLKLIEEPLTKHHRTGDSTASIERTNEAPRCHRADHDHSHSIVSVDGIGLERFHVDIDSFSFESANLRCLETSISLE